MIPIFHIFYVFSTNCGFSYESNTINSWKCSLQMKAVEKKLKEHLFNKMFNDFVMEEAR